MVKVLAALVIGSVSGHAQDTCTSIDLSAGAGDTYIQADTSWCHIFTTTDAFSRHLRNKGVLKPGQRFHPLQFAAAPPIAKERSVVNSTDQTSTMFTDMKALSQVALYPDSKKKAEETRLNEGLCLESDLAEVNPKAFALFNQDWHKARRMFDASDCFAKFKCDRAVPPMAPIRQICDKLSRGEREYWFKLFSKKCRTPWPDWYIEWNHRATRFEKVKQGIQLKPGEDDFDGMLRSSIDHALERGEFAAIGYDPTFMLKGATKADSHWSSIVARKRGPDGKCYYGIRNSWGPKCDDYNDSVECLNNGYLLVSEEELLPRIHTVQQFADRPPKPTLVQPAALKNGR